MFFICYYLTYAISCHTEAFYNEIVPFYIEVTLRVTEEYERKQFAGSGDNDMSMENLRWTTAPLRKVIRQHLPYGIGIEWPFLFITLMRDVPNLTREDELWDVFVWSKLDRALVSIFIFVVHNGPISQIPQLVVYPTVHHFGTEMCTFLFQSGVLWDIGFVLEGFVYGLTWLCSRQISVSKEMQYDDAFTLQKVEPEYVEIFNYMAGMVPFIQKVIAEVRAFILRSRKFRDSKPGCWNYKFHSRLGNRVVETLFKFISYWATLQTNLVASRLQLQKVIAEEFGNWVLKW